MVEQRAHNALEKGSIPLRPTVSNQGVAMAKTKSREATITIVDEPEEVKGVSKADDQTAIDDLKKRKTKEKLSEGYKQRLEGGVIRKIRVVAKRLRKEGGKVFRVTDTETGESKDYDKVKVEGESELVHEIEQTQNDGCRTRITGGSASLQTDAPILVGNGIKARG